MQEMPIAAWKVIVVTTLSFLSGFTTCAVFEAWIRLAAKKGGGR